VLGHVDVGGADLVVMVQLQRDDDDDEDGPTAYWSTGKPRLYGSIAQVAAARPKLLELCGRSEPRWPAKVWPRGESALAPLDEWMTDAERASLRGEIAALRALSPDETTVGRAAHGPLLVRLCERFGFAEDTAAVLAALVLHVAPDRERVAAWSRVKRSALSRHFKKLADAKLVEKHDKDYRPKVPIYQLPGRYRAEPVPAFQRLYFVVSPEFYDSGFRSPPRRCFAEADILGAYVDNV
jgi:hypothetical protein